MGKYDELLEEVKAKLLAFQLLTAREYIPKLYTELLKEDSNMMPGDARDRIEKDCVELWSMRTILDALPDEAKDTKKQKAGRTKQKVENSAAASAARSIAEGQKREEIIINTNGHTVKNGTQQPITSSLTPDLLNKDNGKDELRNRVNLLQFEFALQSDEIFKHIFLSSDKDVWFNGILDKSTGKVITAHLGRLSQYPPNAKEIDYHE
jgi:hypothetical protein